MVPAGASSSGEGDLIYASTMADAVFIYALCDPDSGEIRYVGKAKDPIRRFSVHLCDSSEDDCHRMRWLRKLRRNSKAPVLKIIERVAADRWQERERYWIAYYRAQGARLTNSTSGGDGTPDLPIDVEMARRCKVSNSRRGMKFTERHRAKLSARKLEMYKDPRRRDNLSRMWAVLSDEQVLEIWHLAASRSQYQASIAALYSVPQSTVSEILSGVRYKHVQRPFVREKNQYAGRFDPRSAKCA